MITSMHTDAITHIVMAKYPLRSRDTSHQTTTPITAPATVTTGIVRKGLIPCCARMTRKYAPRPIKVCWPTDTRPAYPASRFQKLAMISSRKNWTIRLVVDE